MRVLAATLIEVHVEQRMNPLWHRAREQHVSCIGITHHAARVVAARAAGTEHFL